ncbi:Por secretion system C-terminal sorting domain-containing protein [Polaribacter sp. Hel1_33_78]|uniref:carbohydrate-binding protein n=1 Tax=Polaribacter sp. Hel1_33_78 TaxID=1336804 RepID=UPI00087A8492|nr:carbohydrate-binding protein [Polaribacter sp. Hel1_33_78]SDT90904.1 Por secretion system C-terminal sorting domain-containing protein [Polaribacter sp. Hel1_33_78]
MKKYFIYIFLVLAISANSQGLRTLGKKIVNLNSEEVLLKGVGLGGWMLQEGYMMNSSGAADTQHEFIQKLTTLIGADKTAEFYTNWRNNFVTKQDVDSIAKLGYNSIRLPMHYNLFTLPIEEEPVEGENTWLNTGFEMVDELLTWCESNQIYLILDLHAAPGGQGKDAAISDYDDTKPSLWESEFNKSKTVALWGKLAERYTDKQWIGGYDLLNEVNWPLGTNVLRDLYVRITNEIRAVDANHILFIEGNGFANDFSGLTPPWDSNMVYSPHKYWTYNDTASMQWVLDIREQHNVPLWLGESGENSNAWFTEAINLFEDNNIGWAWWPWKRIETITCPYSINSNSNYEAIINYWKGEGPQPSVDEAVQGLSQLTTDLLLDNNVYYKDVVDAVLRQPQDETHIPYANHTLPGIVYLSDYDLGTNGIAYYDVDYANYTLSTGEDYQPWNSGWNYRNDGVDIQTNSDNINSNGYHIGYTKNKEWLKYTVEVTETGFYNINFRYATTQSGAKVKLFVNDVDIVGNVNLGNSGGWSNFVNHYIENAYLEAGNQVLKVQVDGNSEFNMSSIEFLKSTDAIPDFEVLSASTNADEKSIKIVLNHPINQTDLTNSLFEIMVNNNSRTIESAEIDASTTRFVKINLADYLFYQDEIKVSYNGTIITSIYNSNLDVFENLTVNNNLIARLLVPGKIQAEEFTNQVGLQTENTTDIGTGQNIGYTDIGDYAEYLIYISDRGNYNLNVRTAAQSNAGKIEFKLINNVTTKSISQIDLPVTGGWQSWQTTSTKTVLDAGVYTLKMEVLKAGFNMNWFEFEFVNSLSLDRAKNNKVVVFPNPISARFYVKLNNQQNIKKLKIIDVNGRLVQKLKPNLINNVYNLSNLNSGIYFLILETDQGSFQKKLIKN